MISTKMLSRFKLLPTGEKDEGEDDLATNYDPRDEDGYYEEDEFVIIVMKMIAKVEKTRLKFGKIFIGPENVMIVTSIAAKNFVFTKNSLPFIVKRLVKLVPVKMKKFVIARILSTTVVG